MKSTETEKLKDALASTISEAAEQIPDRPTKAIIEQLTSSIPHIQEVGASLHTHLDDDKLVWPFVGAARFYAEQSAFHEAEQALVKGYQLVKQRFGEAHPNAAILLSNLAQIYLNQGYYTEAKPLLEKVLKIDLSFYGFLHLEVAVDFTNLAELYREQGCYEDAKSLHIKAIDIQQQLQVVDTTEFAASLNNLALVYFAQDRYVEAESLYKKALLIMRKQFGSEILRLLQVLTIWRKPTVFRNDMEKLKIHILSLSLLSKSNLGPITQMLRLLLIVWENSTLSKVIIKKPNLFSIEHWAL